VGNKEKIIELLKNKASIKQDVFQHGKKAFTHLKESAKEVIQQLSESYSSIDDRVKIKYEDISEQEFRITIGGDILLFHMHTNVFQYNKSHYYWKQSYLKENKTRSYGVIIQVYNFLRDSLIRKREKDLGFLIARIFVNRENNFALESKQNLNTRYPNLSKQKFTNEVQKEIIQYLIIYSMEFELYIPSYSNVQTLSVEKALNLNKSNKMVTSKRLGFQAEWQKEEETE
jgi:hypothetical protein